MKVGTPARIFVTEYRNLDHNPPGSPEALHAIYITAINKEGGNRPDYVPWDPEFRAKMYRGEYRTQPETVAPPTHRCLGCGCPIAVKERCKSCQHEFRQNNYRVVDKTIHCMDCGVLVPYTLKRPKRCPECSAVNDRKMDTESKARRRAAAQGVTA